METIGDIESYYQVQYWEASDGEWYTHTLVRDHGEAITWHLRLHWAGVLTRIVPPLPAPWGVN